MFGLKYFLIVVTSGFVLVSSRAPNYDHQKYTKEANSDDKRMHPELHPLPENFAYMKIHEAELESQFWQTLGKKIVKDNLNKPLKKVVAKNVILFLGDGLSMATTTATRSFQGDPNQRLSYEAFPFTGMSKTYCVDRQVADSACTSTAYLCGVKGNYQTIGVNAKVAYKNCDAELAQENRTPSIAEWALNEGKGAGLVTNMRVTHASPVKI